MSTDDLMVADLAFKGSDVVTIRDIARRMSVSEYTAGELIRQWKLILKRVERDRLDIKGKITKEDYAYILGMDVKLLY